MRRAEELKLIDSEAYQAALNLMNPFPDDADVPAGWPCSSGVGSIRNVFRDTISVDASGLTTTDTWSFAVVFTPVASTLIGTHGVWDPSTGVITGGVLDVQGRGTWNVYRWLGNNYPDFTVNGPYATAQLVNVLAPNSMTRLCGAGMEAINTSASLYRGGMGYAYRLPSNYANLTRLSPSSGVTSVSQWENVQLACPIFNPDFFTNLNTTYMGPAHNGICAISLPSTSENKPTMFGPHAYQVSNYNTLNCYYSVTSSAPTWDWTTCGIVVTGLTPQSTFTIKCKAYLENLPLAIDDFTSSLTSPCVPYSPLLRELVSQVLHHMPAGFDYSENPFGEWMSKVLDGISNVLPIIGDALPFPGSGAIARGISAAAQLGSKALSGKPALQQQQRSAQSNNSSASSSSRSRKKVKQTQQMKSKTNTNKK